ncbi:NAD kinase [Limimaricola cinnabarinus LL-001]|uniref:NAD kinase n=1 Tax=Limimaricola cinnabarinus LL-001 TaxID=1337093 RepID=U2YZX4_9RHOB|nr:NAD kinase [Limimaricola cinnabarinus LL-001]
MGIDRIAFLASETPVAQETRERLAARYGDSPLDEADIVVALGGDGFMLQTLHATEGLDLPVYGMNRGTVGFLMNAFSEDDLPERLAAAEEAIINLSP